MGREKLPRQAQRPLARCFPSFPPRIRSTIRPYPRKVDPLSLLGLPAELHAEIIGHLSFPGNANLKRTCRYFRDLVTFGHAEQIEAELLFGAICVECKQFARAIPDSSGYRYTCLSCGTAIEEARTAFKRRVEEEVGFRQAQMESRPI